jgi:hypothetical protein
MNIKSSKLLKIIVNASGKFVLSIGMRYCVHEAVYSNNFLVSISDKGPFPSFCWQIRGYGKERVTRKAYLREILTESVPHKLNKTSY